MPLRNCHQHKMRCHQHEWEETRVQIKICQHVFTLKHMEKNRLVTWKTMRPMRPNPLMPIFVASAAAKIEAPNWRIKPLGKKKTFKKALKRWRCRYVLDSPARLEQENLSAGSFLTFPISVPIPSHQIWH